MFSLCSFFLKVFAFAYILMTNKSQPCYESVFNFIHEHIMSLNCASFTTDYETAMRNALAKLYPNAVLYACYFHYTQAVKKNAWKTAGLVNLIRTNAKARSVYYRLQCLPLLPAQFITDAFLELKAEANKINRSIFRPFLQYMNRQWLVRVSIFCATQFLSTNNNFLRLELK